MKCSMIQTTRSQQSGSSLFWHTHIPLSTDTLSETKVIALNVIESFNTYFYGYEEDVL